MINELTNNHAKELAKLKQKKFRSQQNKTIVEGLRLIDQLTTYGITFEELIITDPDDFDLSKYSTKLSLLANDFQMKRITDTITPQSIAAVISIDSIPLNETKFLLYLDGISDPGNMGTIFRTATAAGVSGIVLSPECCEIYNPKVIRASLGSVFHLPSETHEYKWLKSLNNSIIATSLENSTNIFDLEKPASLILVIGSEAFGVRPVILEFADHCVNIPIHGNIESMNAAVASGIAIYHFIDK